MENNNDLFNYEDHSSENNKFNHEDKSSENNNFYEGQLIHALYEETTEEKPKNKHSKFLTKKAAAIICALGLVFSSGVGFGGGYLAAHQNILGTTTNKIATTTSKIPTTTVDTSSAGTSTVAQVAAATASSVVEIRTESTTTDTFMRQYVSEGAGSGVILTKDGYIVTNNHVIDGAKKITVTLKNGKTYSGKLVGADSTTDLAIVKIEETNLSPATLGTSASLHVGDLAVAIGNPLGQLGGTVTDGIISALDREISLGGETMDLLQTNAAINPGNSGGGLFDQNGNLIGIVVAKSSGSGVEGLGFAIPIDGAKTIINQLMKTGYITGRASFGITTLDISDTQTAAMYGLSETGVYVYSVENAALSSSLKSGDRIVSVKGTDVNTNAEIKKVLKGCSVGQTVAVVIKRDGKQATVKVKLVEQNTSASSNSNSNSNSGSPSINGNSNFYGNNNNNSSSSSEDGTI